VGLEASEEERAPRVGQPGSTFAYDPLQPIVWPSRPAQGKPTQDNYHKGKGQALYMQDLVSLTEQWKLLLGLRYDSYDFQSTNKIANLTRKTDGNGFSPRVGVVWQPVREHSFYASWNKSYSPYGGRGILIPTPGPSGARTVRAASSSARPAAWPVPGMCAAAWPSCRPRWLKTRKTPPTWACTCVTRPSATATCSCAMRPRDPGMAKSA